MIKILLYKARSGMEKVARVKVNENIKGHIILNLVKLILIR